MVSPGENNYIILNNLFFFKVKTPKREACDGLEKRKKNPSLMPPIIVQFKGGTGINNMIPIKTADDCDVG